MISIIFGEPGLGKTCLLTKKAIDNMCGDLAFERLRNTKKLIKGLQMGGFPVTQPTVKHVVYADYPISTKRVALPTRQSNYIDGFRLSLEQKDFETQFVEYGAWIGLDEAQRYLNSRMFKGFKHEQSRFYETHRHFGYDIILACQRFGLIDKNVRELAGCIIEIVKLKHYYNKYNELVESVWDVIEYSENPFTDSGAKKDSAKGVKKREVFKGNIFKCYNSQQFMLSHLQGRGNKDFERMAGIDFAMNQQGLKGHTEFYGYQEPEKYRSK